MRELPNDKKLLFIRSIVRSVEHIIILCALGIHENVFVHHVNKILVPFLFKFSGIPTSKLCFYINLNYKGLLLPCHESEISGKLMLKPCRIFAFSNWL